ncbi:hypothetical protein [Eubacterium sp.]|uniref:hypothetical protein n=1 Tax=Eubacterium sp. TaxID=142586 RepID=UPI0035204726
MIYIKYLIAIIIVAICLVIASYIYFYLTRKFILFKARIWYDLDFENLPDGEIMKKAYLKKYLRKMIVCGAVFWLIAIILFISQTDFGYYEIYPLKTLLVNSQLADESHIKYLLESFLAFFMGFAFYPYKFVILMLFPMSGGFFDKYDD